jgi:hypothetical protein
MDLVTDVMELAAVLLLIAAAAVFVGQLSLPGGLATAGVGLFVGSWLISRKATPRGPAS